MTDSGAERAARRIWEIGYVGIPPKPNPADEQEIKQFAAIIREETGAQWLVLYAKLRERECCCNVCPEQGYNDICEWCAEHPEGDWDHVEAALTEAGLSLDDPFAPLPAAPDEGGKR